MPLITSSFRSPRFLANAHSQTIWPALTRKVPNPGYARERFELPDGDFLDLDWSRVGSKRLAIVLHGLEASAHEHYVMAMVNALNKRGWDAVGINQRSCSGEANRLWRSYHSGETNDLDLVIQRIRKQGDYDSIVLHGFSLGGNIVLKYAGEQGEALVGKVDAVSAASVPVHLNSCAAKINTAFNGIYNKRFMKFLKEKLQAKAHLAPDSKTLNRLLNLKVLTDFDEYYTAPAHGFKDAEDYYTQSRCLNFLPEIKIPTFLLNAQDDPFLTPECFPYEIAKNHKYLRMEAPRKGGHVGFVNFNKEKEYWLEKRVPQFFANVLGM